MFDLFFFMDGNPNCFHGFEDSRFSVLREHQARN